MFRDDALFCLDLELWNSPMARANFLSLAEYFHLRISIDLTRMGRFRQLDA